ncbi:site-2 protease family protein [Rariglobus hedericola]|uniref:Site-2 protease family protein n=1 Tax=Rariglobus hedericola TaxID=2597822 RepID=A0A556QJC7_9BACT|nr:site-2 protease family protein [Rariglobus hedericola]TSJ76711.1 site-2 protease family protein [Rariglobus hedericola]
MTNGIGLAELREGLIFYIFLVTSLSIHEWAHAFTADKLGDPTPSSQGRVTLNPIAHMDLMGTVIFPLLCIFVLPGNFLFGWGKPVMINTSYFRHRVRDDILTTMAGPGSNLVLALLAAIIGGLCCRFIDPALAQLVGTFIFLNVVLAVFNMIPIPPLDGSHILRHAVGMSDETYYNLSRWGFVVLIVAINLPPIRAALGYAIDAVSTPFVLLFKLVAG